MKKYYDPEYDRVVDETEIKRQYNWFKENLSFWTKSYEQFRQDNFIENFKEDQKWI